MRDKLPSSIDRILEYLAGMAASYSGGLKWNEEAMLKSDLMLNRERWSCADVAQIRARLLELGMSNKDTSTVVDYISRAQSGKRLVPQRSYRSFTFTHADD